MSTLAVFHPTDLVAFDLRVALDERPELWRDIKLISDRADEIGTLTEARGRATVVLPLEEDSFSGVDIAFLFGDFAELEPLVAKIPAGTRVILASQDTPVDFAHAIVYGLNEAQSHEHRRLQSPHPAAVGLALLLAPLRAFGLRRVNATLLQPVSSFGKAGLEEMFEQTREMLSFQSPQHLVLPRQIAFNVLHINESSGPAEEQLRSLLGPEVKLSVHLLRVGAFHGLGLAVTVVFEADPGLESLRSAFVADRRIALCDADELLGVIDAAGRDEVLVGPIEADPQAGPGCYKIWAVLDNLTRGGALNLFGIFETLCPDPIC
jgi:aspartate-semialdehyde dehydrogenase